MDDSTLWDWNGMRMSSGMLASRFEAQACVSAEALEYLQQVVCREEY